MSENDHVTIERRAVVKRPFSLLDRMFVEPGSLDDWLALRHLHYKSEGNPIGPHYWRCIMETPFGDQLIGVVVLSVPRLLLRPRHKAFPKLKPGQDTHITNVYRAKYINRYFRINNRTVVDTAFRGVGVSYRMLNLAARLEGRRFVEIQSSMSKFNPFAMRAGFKFVEPELSDVYDRGVTLMGRYFDAHPADSESCIEEFERMSAGLQNKALRELRAFYYKHSSLEKTGSNLHAGTGRVEGLGIREILEQISRLVFAWPMYGVYPNPDYERELPERVPLAAFDRQAVNKPLDLTNLS